MRKNHYRLPVIVFFDCQQNFILYFFQESGVANIEARFYNFNTNEIAITVLYSPITITDIELFSAPIGGMSGHSESIRVDISLSDGTYLQNVILFSKLVSSKSLSVQFMLQQQCCCSKGNKICSFLDKVFDKDLPS